MKQNVELPATSDVGGAASTQGEVSEARASEPLQKLLDSAQDEPLATPFKKKTDAPESTGRGLEPLQEQVAVCAEELPLIRKELQRLQTADRVLSEMHSRCKELNEQFHEREVLGPVFLGLIAIVDRCVQQARRIEQALGKTKEAESQPAQTALRHLLDARNADRVEVENMLAHLGVEPFRHASDTFDPRSQKCVGRVETGNGIVVDRVAVRVSPGYKRNGRHVRPEYVKVYVNGNGRTSKSGG